jgi:cyclophilin family peptidyl-prolyl cis-trans isomerase
MRAPRPVQIATAYLDNRGQAFFTVTVALNKATLSRKSATLLTAGADGQFGTADDARVYTAVGYRRGRLSLRANLPLNTRYRVRLNASTIKDVNGLALDGEFKAGKPSGNGFAGGNYDVVSTLPAKTRVRFSTTAGFINVGLYRNTPITKSNFMHYANEAAWDTTFFHRSEHHVGNDTHLDVIQGGGFNIINGQLGSVHMETGIELEGSNSNLQGTIAMARGTATNSNTNQWFFNTKANTVLDGQYTVFGAVLDTESLNTITAINNLTILDASSTLGGTFGELPVVRPNATAQNVAPSDVVMVTRVAQLFDIAATPNVQSAVKRSVVTTNPATAAPLATTASPFLVTPTKKNDLFAEEEA